jgi:hypothetical protein
MQQGMFNFLRNLFPSRRRSRFDRMFGRNERALTPRRGGIALGSLLSLAAPFIINRMRQRRAQRAF